MLSGENRVSGDDCDFELLGRRVRRTPRTADRRPIFPNSAHTSAAASWAEPTLRLSKPQTSIGSDSSRNGPSVTLVGLRGIFPDSFELAELRNLSAVRAPATLVRFYTIMETTITCQNSLVVSPDTFLHARRHSNLR